MFTFLDSRREDKMFWTVGSTTRIQSPLIILQNRIMICYCSSQISQLCHIWDLKVCDEGTLVQILCFWTLSMVLSLSKNRPVYFWKHNVSKTGFCLRLQVKPTQLGPIDRASPYLRTPVPAPRFQSRYFSGAEWEWNGKAVQHFLRIELLASLSL
jgi:hypothetical protein